jgi:hypothetical protein
MCLRIGLPFLCVLAALLLVPPLPAATAPSVPDLRPGSLEIAFDPAAVSVLPVDAEALSQNLCNGLIEVDGFGGISPTGECVLTVSTPGGMVLETGGMELHGESLKVAVQPLSSLPWQVKAPLLTSCGLWDISLDLDPKQAQPVSRLALEPASIAEPVQGVFAGVVKLAVRFRFVSRDKGTAIELPATIPLELSGHWAALPKDGPSLGEDASNLVLFAGVVGGQWANFPNCVTWVGTHCRLCLRTNLLGLSGG